MSTTRVQTLLDDAATRFGDPLKTRFNDVLLIGHYNDACKDISRRWSMIEVDASFSWVANEDRYAYPDDCVQMLRLQYNPDPANDPNGLLWRKCYQMTEQEYVDRTDGSKPTNEDKIFYWARTNFFVVWPVPGTSVSQGGKIGYWKLCDIQTSATTAVDVTGQTYTRTTIELPNAIDTLLRDRMVIGMQMSLGRIEEAQLRMAAWEVEMDKVAPRIEDPVEDRREHYTPKLVRDWTRVV